MAEVQGALTGLVNELRKRQGWTMDRLADVAGVSEAAIQKVLDAPAQLRSGDTTLRALSTALQVDAWLLERAASSPRENVDELVRLAERVSGGSLTRARRLVGDAVPDSLDEAIAMARATVTPNRQLELAELITAFTKLDVADREILLAVAGRMLLGPVPRDRES